MNIWISYTVLLQKYHTVVKSPSLIALMLPSSNLFVNNCFIGKSNTVPKLSVLWLCILFGMQMNDNLQDPTKS